MNRPSVGNSISNLAYQPLRYRYPWVGNVKSSVVCAFVAECKFSVASKESNSPLALHRLLSAVG